MKKSNLSLSSLFSKPADKASHLFQSLLHMICLRSLSFLLAKAFFPLSLSILSSFAICSAIGLPGVFAHLMGYEQSSLFHTKLKETLEQGKQVLLTRS